MVDQTALPQIATIGRENQGVAICCDAISLDVDRSPGNPQVFCLGLALIRFRTIDGLRKHRELVQVQQTVMIFVGTSELHFEKSKDLLLGHRFRRCDRSHIFLDRHEKNLRLQVKHGRQRVKMLLKNGVDAF
jgi:hypothetical protein